jgi:hypothetical protein
LILFSWSKSIFYKVSFSHSHNILNFTHHSTFTYCISFIHNFHVHTSYFLYSSFCHTCSSHRNHIHILTSISQSLTSIDFSFSYFSSLCHSLTHIIFTFI